MVNRADYVRLNTSMGEIEIELYWDHAPRACENFQRLSETKYYDQTVFHRVVKNFVVQGGDPSGTGKGGKSIWGSSFPDEIHPGLKHVGAGIICVANSGPNTNGSQFFITLAPLPFLDGKDTIFGRVKRGMKVVQRMNFVPTNKFDRPLADIKIFSSTPMHDH